jgi:excisionase family DNA binding protein
VVFRVSFPARSRPHKILDEISRADTTRNIDLYGRSPPQGRVATSDASLLFWGRCAVAALELPKLLTPKETAAILRVSPGTLAVWRCVKRYALPFVKVGRSVRYREEDIAAFLANGGPSEEGGE